jgi:hypothetical protein
LCDGRGQFKWEDSRELKGHILAVLVTSAEVHIKLISCWAKLTARKGETASFSGWYNWSRGPTGTTELFTWHTGTRRSSAPVIIGGKMRRTARGGKKLMAAVVQQATMMTPCAMMTNSGGISQVLFTYRCGNNFGLSLHIPTFNVTHFSQLRNCAAVQIINGGHAISRCFPGQFKDISTLRILTSSMLTIRRA